ncbi:MAG: bifunctional oligoribonuclease/PAP phosphatase NrnA [Candidatus Omnitrophica bacterium]|nr:bifunctional oligoribonuclease/PAP phosphatase NrnA [Candidatus Omnitrophota bacterium]
MFLSDSEKKTVSKICDALRKNKNFILTSHQVPDGDGLGCELAFFWILQRLGKKALVINELLPPRVYSFLPGFSEVLPFDAYKEKEFIPDAAMVFDCSSKDRVGKPLLLIPESATVINIDHHQGNSLFGDVNWVCKNRSSVGEMSFFIANYLGLLDKRVAECLYVSILTDTGSFRHNFNSDTINVVSELLKTGIDPENIADNVYHNNSLQALKLLGYALISLQYEPTFKVAWSVLSEQIFKKIGATEQDIELVIDILRSVEKTDFVFIVKERRDEIKFSLRSRKHFNVRKIAENFGGGGHNSAAGFSIRNCTLELAIEEFFRYLRKNITDSD